MNLPEQELVLVDEDQTYSFVIAPGESGGKSLAIQAQTIESWDKTQMSRVALHPWMGGMGPNRISPGVTIGGSLANRPSMLYAKANADASNPNYLTAPPLLNELGGNITVLFYNTPVQLRYGSSAYGTVTYMGAASSSGDITKVIRNFAGKAYFAGGQFLYSLDANYTFTTVHDFGAGKNIADIEIFNDELIIAMGESEKIYKMTSAEAFTQASDDVYAIALAAVGDLLWRAHDINQMDNCIDDPLSLSSWTPADPNEYTCGNTSYSITDLIEYGGVVAAIRPDGVYFPDGSTVFHNQTPQLRDYPHPDNGKGAWVAWGYLWVPSISGLLRVAVGESIPVGPELSGRPDFRFFVRSGVEFNGDIYLVCNDQAGVENTFVCKMTKDYNNYTDNPYIYHEWLRFGSIAPSYMITVYITPTNPTMIAGRGAGIYYWLMGRGSGITVDDSNYALGEAYELDTGDFVAVEDRGIRIKLVSVKVIGKQPADSSLQIQWSMDRSGVFQNLLTTQNGGGTTEITDEGFFNRQLYAPIDAVGNVPRIKLVGTLPAGILGPDRPEIYEAWAYFNAVTENTDIITVGVYSDRRARVRGLMQGRIGTNLDLIRNWYENQTILTTTIPGYMQGQIIRVAIIDYSDSSLSMIKEGSNQVPTSITKLVMRRVDFSG